MDNICQFKLFDNNSAVKRTNDEMLYLISIVFLLTTKNQSIRDLLPLRFFCDENHKKTCNNANKRPFFFNNNECSHGKEKISFKYGP